MRATLALLLCACGVIAYLALQRDAEEVHRGERQRAFPQANGGFRAPGKAAERSSSASRSSAESPPAGGVLVHVVALPDGRPVAGATVTAAGRHAATDLRGYARLALQWKRNLTVSVVKRGYVPASACPATENPAEIYAALRPGAPVRVEGRFAETGRPASHARITAWWDTYPGRYTLDREGRCELPGVPDGSELRIDLSIPGFVKLEDSRRTPLPEDCFRIVVYRGATLTGTVIDEQGTPSSGAHVRLEKVRTPQVEVVTDHQGRFCIRGMAPNTDYEAIATAPGIRGASQQVRFADRGESRDVLLQLEQQAGVLAEVLAPDGTPLPNVRLSVDDPADGKLWARGAGRLALGPLTPGARTLRVFADGWPVLTREVTVSPSALSTVVVHLSAGERLQGVVVDEKGGPLPAYGVEFVSPKEDALCFTDARGHFLLQGLGQETGELTAGGGEGERLREWRREIAPGAPSIRIELRASCRVVGQITTLPVSRTLDCQWGVGDETVFPTLELDPNGRFSLWGVPANRPFWLQLELPDSAPLIRTGIRLKPGETLDLRTIRPTSGATLHGVVRSETGTPLPGVDITFSWRFSTDDDHSLSTTTDARGGFRIRGVPSVPGLLQAGKTIWREVDSPEAAPFFDLVSRPPGTLEAFVHGAPPSQLSDYIFRAVPAGLNAEGIELDQQGSSRVLSSRLPPGKYVLRISTDGFAWTDGPTVEVVSGQTTKTEIRLP